MVQHPLLFFSGSTNGLFLSILADSILAAAGATEKKKEQHFSEPLHSTDTVIYADNIRISGAVEKGEVQGIGLFRVDEESMTARYNNEDELRDYTVRENFVERELEDKLQEVEELWKILKKALKKVQKKPEEEQLK
ncbi:hypothetical protein ILUMI_04595 [Ignelater luminosus]|uniref:Uncharacterized protein n=1 Tax=Ignelater luminosus TaxID=2038154 RepID=A0A8K0GJF8_IGNLU|nr:hypothetical protein ILUMI_04595 [Ignelater luminosus]